MSEINQDQQQNTERPSEATPVQPEAPAPQPTAAQPASQPASAQKANIGKRIVAAIIDGVLVGVVSLVPFIGWLVGIAYSFLKDGLNFGGLDNRSIGKKLLGLKVINTETGNPTDYKDSLLRNVIFIIPCIAIVELILVISDEKGIRLGDKIAKTMVIDE